MIHTENEKSVVVIKPTSVATTATATGRIDTRGFNWCSVDVILDSAAATSSNPATLNLSEGTITTFASATTVSGFVGDSDFTVPAASTDTPQTVRFEVDCRTRERYLFVSVTPAGATQLLAAQARLSRAELTPTNAATTGAAELVTG